MDAWNDLQEWVINSENVFEFERKLDKVWANQDQRYNHREKIKTTTANPLSCQPDDQVQNINTNLEPQA